MTALFVDYQDVRIKFYITNGGACRIWSIFEPKRDGRDVNLKFERGCYTARDQTEWALSMAAIANSGELKPILKRELDSWIKRLQKASKSLQDDPPEVLESRS